MPELRAVISDLRVPTPESIPKLPRLHKPLARGLRGGSPDPVAANGLAGLPSGRPSKVPRLRLHNACAVGLSPPFCALPLPNGGSGRSLPSPPSPSLAAKTTFPSLFRDFRVFRGYSPRGKIPMPVGRNSNARRKKFLWALESTPMPEGKHSNAHQTGLPPQRPVPTVPTPSF